MNFNNFFMTSFPIEVADWSRKMDSRTEIYSKSSYPERRSSLGLISVPKNASKSYESHFWWVGFTITGVFGVGI
jgi:hypothetical protein